MPFDRLARHAPELHAQVLAGQLTAHAAMIRAGLRPRTFAVRSDQADSVARALRTHLDPGTLTDVRRLLAKWDGR